MSIPYDPEKGKNGKGILSHLFIPVVLVLVAVISFALGRLSAVPPAPEVTIAGYTEKEKSVAAVTNAEPLRTISTSTEKVGQKKYVAAKSGKAYYLPACSGVGRIKEENKVWFATKEEAENAGYTPAKNCPGL